MLIRCLILFNQKGTFKKGLLESELKVEDGYIEQTWSSEMVPLEHVKKLLKTFTTLVSYTHIYIQKL